MDIDHEIPIRAAANSQLDVLETWALDAVSAHIEAAHLWGGLHWWLGIPATVLAAIISGVAAAGFPGSDLVVSVAAMLVAILSGLVTFLNPNEQVAANREAANKARLFLGRVTVFRFMEQAVLPVETVVEQVKAFHQEYSDLGLASPYVPGRIAKRVWKENREKWQKIQDDHSAHGPEAT